MLFLVRMDVHIPHDLAPAQVDDIKAREKAYAQQLQHDGQWQHLWRVVGEYANYSVFDVDSNDSLHQILSQLPLFPYMKLHVTPLAQHPSAIA
jgi:muconolactone D-isomerase